MELTPYRNLNPGEDADKNILMLVYFCYLLVAITGIVGPIIGMILAIYFRKKMSSQFGTSHINMLLRTSKIMFLVVAFGFFLVLLSFAIMYFLDLSNEYDLIVLPGVSIVLVAFFWLLYKVGVGLTLLLKGYDASS